MLIGCPAPPRRSAPGRGGAARAAAIAAAFAVVAAAGSACGGGDAPPGGDAAPAAESPEVAFSDGVPTGFPLPSGARRLGPAQGGGTAVSPFVASFEVADRGGDEVAAWLREALPASGFRIMDDDATTSMSSDYEQVASWVLQKEGTDVLTTLLVREYPDGSTRLVLRSTKI